MTKVTKYIKDSIVELKKVTWPNKKEVRRHTFLVILISFLMAAFLGIADYILNLGLENII